jgi:DNA-binding Lrp family transcriptional regulator
MREALAQAATVLRALLAGELGKVDDRHRRSFGATGGIANHLGNRCDRDVSGLLERPSDSRDRALARLSFAFLLDEVSQGVAGLKPLDALLVLAINQANIAPLTRDPEARARYGQLEAPAPDHERRPVSINAIAASLVLPFETVRRRVKGLCAAGVCVITPEGVVIPSSFLASPAYLQSVLTGHERLRRFYFDLRAAELVEDLPDSAFPREQVVPVRAAARLLSDYVLRVTEALMREVANVVSLMVLLALIDAAVAEPPRSLSASGLARTLRLPLETVRRHLALLQEAGLCGRRGPAVAMPPHVLEGPQLSPLMSANAANVQRLLAGLAERGVVAAWESA